jgi:hypothetical protein
MFPNLLFLRIWIIILPIGLVGIIALVLSIFLLLDYSFLAHCFLLLERLSLFLFLFFIGIWSYLSDSASSLLPHVLNFFLNLLVQHWIVSRSIFRVDMSKAVVR